MRTLDGSETKVKVPEGTQSGRQFKVRAKGMPALRGRDMGDLYIQAIVETPQNLTRRQRELLEEFEGEFVDPHTPRGQRFLLQDEGLLRQYQRRLKRAGAVAAKGSPRRGGPLS